MTSRVVVINPNSSQAITAQIRDAVATIPSHNAVDVITSTGGPVAIESDGDVVASIKPMLGVAAANPAEAYVVACFSDPGLDDLRAESGVAAFGIAESAIHLAIAQGGNVGVISSIDASIPRHNRYWERLGVAGHIKGDVAVGLGVLELDTDEAYARVLDAGRDLIGLGATTLVLGCTGLTHMQRGMEEELGVTIIDPCLAATSAAVTSLSAQTGSP